MGFQDCQTTWEARTLLFRSSVGVPVQPFFPNPRDELSNTHLRAQEAFGRVRNSFATGQMPGTILPTKRPFSSLGESIVRAVFFKKEIFRVCQSSTARFGKITFPSAKNHPKIQQKRSDQQKRNSPAPVLVSSVPPVCPALRRWQKLAFPLEKVALLLRVTNEHRRQILLSTAAFTRAFI